MTPLSNKLISVTPRLISCAARHDKNARHFKLLSVQRRTTFPVGGFPHRAAHQDTAQQTPRDQAYRTSVQPTEMGDRTPICKKNIYILFNNRQIKYNWKSYDIEKNTILYSLRSLMRAVWSPLCLFDFSVICFWLFGCFVFLPFADVKDAFKKEHQKNLMLR